MKRKPKGQHIWTICLSRFFFFLQYNYNLNVFLPRTMLKFCCVPPYHLHSMFQIFLSFLKNQDKFSLNQLNWTGELNKCCTFSFLCKSFQSLFLRPQWLTPKALAAQRIVPVFPFLALSRLLTRSSLSQITKWEIRGGTDLRPWIHYGPDPIMSLKCPCCSPIHCKLCTVIRSQSPGVVGGGEGLLVKSVTKCVSPLPS